MPLPDVPDELIRRYDVAGPRYTSYPTAPMWTDSFGPEAYAAALERASSDPAPLSLYVHIPFCRELCTYCGCHVVVTKSAERVERYLDVVKQEIALVAERLGPRRRVTRLHWGGGTPTTLDEGQLERLYRMLTDHFRLEPDAELALEIDPVVTSPGQMETLAALGFRRLSMGVQDFDPSVQQAICRTQSVEETRAHLDKARALGFESVNFDLIYGLPRQTPESWARTLDQVAELRPDRIAIFSFAYVPEVKPQQRRLGVFGLPSPTEKLALFRVAHARMEAAGYRAIGMDHFALPDDELARADANGTLWRDFQGYTVQRGAETVAFGVSGIGYVGGAYAQNVKSIGDHREAVLAGRLPIERGIVLSDDDRLRRELITAIMCRFAVELPAGHDFSAELARLRPLADDGLVRLAQNRVEVTHEGRLFVRNVAMAFDAYYNARGTSRPRFSRVI